MRYQAILRQWTTKEIISPKRTEKSHIDFEFRGFHGNYEMTLSLADGKSLTKEFSVEPTADSPLLLDVYLDSGYGL